MGRTHKEQGITGKAICETFYMADWTNAKDIGMASACARGVWWECLLAMWSERNCSITGSTEDVAKSLRVTLREFRTFLIEARKYNFCTLSGKWHDLSLDLSQGGDIKGDEIGTVTCRRLQRRQRSRLKKRKQRGDNSGTEGGTNDKGENVPALVPGQKGLPSSPSSPSPSPSRSPYGTTTGNGEEGIVTPASLAAPDGAATRAQEAEYQRPPIPPEENVIFRSVVIYFHLDEADREKLKNPFEEMGEEPFDKALAEAQGRNDRDYKNFVVNVKIIAKEMQEGDK
jgi:hypothetical protein